MKSKKYFVLKSQWIFLLLSLVWCLFVINYLSISGWWTNRSSLSPIELVGGIGELLIPIVILFLVCAYYDRNEYIERQGKHLRSYLEELIYPTEEGAIYTKELTKALQTQIKEFREVFTGVNTHTDNVRENLQRWIEGLNKLVKTVDTQTVTVVQKVADHVQKLAEITHQSNRQSQESTKLLAGQADMLNSVSEKSQKVMTGFVKELNQEIREIQNILHAFETARTQIGQTTSSSLKIAQALSESSVSVNQAAEKFGGTKVAIQELSNLRDEMAESEKNLHSYANNLKNVLSSVHGDINIVAKGLAQHTQTLEKHLDRKVEEKRLFLQQASEIVSQLQEFSVELAHLFTPKNEESLWAQYYAGDRAIFMRHLAQSIRQSKAEKIRQLFQKNAVFQTNVKNYMRTFEQMSYQAGETDSPLLAVLVGSDVGRLYMVLAEILKGDKHEN